jgi:hypothetical protein
VHPQALAWVERHRTDKPVAVLDIGGRNINGTPRGLFPNASPYRVLDIAPGDGVDVVADAATWAPDQSYDVVVCCEVFEHTAAWPAICATALAALAPRGQFIATMAGPGRPPHSAVDGGPVLYDGEHYGNVEPAALLEVLISCGFAGVLVDQSTDPDDVRAVAYRPPRRPT